LPGSKTVTNDKSNKFNALSNLADQPNYSPATQKLPPRPHATNTARPNKGNTDPKRRRRDDDDNNHVTATSHFPTNLTTKIPNNLNKPVPSTPLQPTKSPHLVFDQKNLDSFHQKSATFVNPNFDQLAVGQHTNDPPDDNPSPHKSPTNEENDDLEICEEIQVHRDHNEENMVT
jgi:hypothetical protein